LAFADYYSRTALAASQILAGFNEPRIRAALDRVRVGIAIGADAAQTPEGRAIVDLSVRLLARIYPTIVIRGEGSAARSLSNTALGLAQQINPNIDSATEPTVEVAIGKELPPAGTWKRIFVGSSAWNALMSLSAPREVGNSDNPFGAGASACLGAANLFRYIFLGSRANLDQDIVFSTLTGEPTASPNAAITGSLGEIVLVGAGAIGNAAAWALSRVRLDGVVHVVDHQTIDLGNLQRYILAGRRHESTVKVEALGEYFKDSVRLTPHHQRFADFVASHGYHWQKMLLALDSADDRRAAQASLPEWVANAWTQPGDLGVSTHDFVNGACVSCLYLPEGPVENEDAIIASVLNMSDKLMQVRVLLHTGEGLSREFLEGVAVARDIPIERLLPFEGRPINILYSEGVCGGAVIPLGSAGLPRQEVHVPLAHQSALSGILLAASAVRRSLGLDKAGTSITRIDVMATLAEYLTQAAAKHPRGICICQDADYLEVYRSKYA
jgi:hypothetical protein